MARPTFSLIEFYDADSPYVTEYRRLLHRILNYDSQAELKSIMVTSAMIAEGKSTVCSFLAMTAAKRKGLKTLLIDSDLRLPSIHKLFDMDQSPGVVEILTEGFNPKDALRKTDIHNLDLLLSGRHTENPAEIFDAEAIGALIDEMKFYYDLILVDCAPILPVSDPMLLASKIDGTILVVKAGATQRELVERGAGILNPARNRVLGVVLNNMNHSLPYYFDYDYYHYDYRQPPGGKSGKTDSADGNTRKKNISTPDDQAIEDNISKN